MQESHIANVCISSGGPFAYKCVPLGLLYCAVVAKLADLICMSGRLRDDGILCRFCELQLDQ